MIQAFHGKSCHMQPTIYLGNSKISLNNLDIGKGYTIPGTCDVAIMKTFRNYTKLALLENVVDNLDKKLNRVYNFC